MLEAVETLVTLQREPLYIVRNHFLSRGWSADGGKISQDLREGRVVELLGAYVESALDLIHAGLVNGSLKRKLDSIFMLVVYQSLEMLKDISVLYLFNDSGCSGALVWYLMVVSLSLASSCLMK
jgi:hypothetical protein